MSADPFQRLEDLAAKVKADRQEREAARKAEVKRRSNEVAATQQRAQHLALRLERFLPDIEHAAERVVRLAAYADGMRLVVHIGRRTVYGDVIDGRWVLDGATLETDLQVMEHVAALAAEELQRELNPDERLPCPHCSRTVPTIRALARHVCHAHPGEYPHLDPFALNEKGIPSNDLTPWIAAVEDKCACE